MVYGIAAARLEVLWTFTRRNDGSWTVVGAHPVGLGDRGQNRLFGWEHRLPGWVERCAPRFGAVPDSRDEHYRGTSLAPALHVHLASPADIHQAGEVLVVLAELPLVAEWLLALGLAASAVAAAPSTTATAVATSTIIFFFDTLPPDLVKGGQEAPSCTLTRRLLATLRTQSTISVGSAYRPNELGLRRMDDLYRCLGVAS